MAQSITRAPALPGPEPLHAWVRVIEDAASDAHLSARDLCNVDSLRLLDCMSWPYDNPAGRLADAIGATPRVRVYADPSGTSGHKAVRAAADAIERGESRFSVVVGGEALASVRTFRKTGETPPWSFPGTSPAFDLDARQHPDEVAAGLTADVGAVYSFALRDVARRAHLGIAPEEYLRSNAELCAGMTEVAASNPYAWFPESKTPEFVATPRPDNRWVAYPYVKHMVSMIEVDLAGAVILTSEEHARTLGVPREKWVYPWAGALLHDPVFVAVRPNLWESPAMKSAAGAVLEAHDLSVDELDLVDLYSCFPAAVNFAQDALGSTRSGSLITTTGGLPYAGGAGSSYSMSSLPTLVGGLRQTDTGVGLASSVGMLMSDHAFGLYGKLPATDFKPVDEANLQQALDALPQKRIVRQASGEVTVCAYTIMYRREGTRAHAAVVCDVEDGSRAYGSIFDDSLLQAAEETELVGQRLWLEAGSPGRVGTLKSL